VQAIQCPAPGHRGNVSQGIWSGRVTIHLCSCQSHPIIFHALIYKQDLIADLKSELSGDFEDLIVGLMMPKDKYLAKHLRKAIKGIGTSDDVLVEILCAYSYDELMKIAATYKSSNIYIECSLLYSHISNIFFLFYF
jgi:hypothetical protein